MLDARDAMIAADQLRFGGANAKELWAAFARRGMGRDASTPTPDSEDVVPSFVAPRHDPREGHLHLDQPRQGLRR